MSVFYSLYGKCHTRKYLGSGKNCDKVQSPQLFPLSPPFLGLANHEIGHKLKPRKKGHTFPTLSRYIISNKTYISSASLWEAPEMLETMATSLILTVPYLKSRTGERNGLAWKRKSRKERGKNGRIVATNSAQKQKRRDDKSVIYP